MLSVGRSPFAPLPARYRMGHPSGYGARNREMACPGPLHLDGRGLPMTQSCFMPAPRRLPAQGRAGRLAVLVVFVTALIGIGGGAQPAMAGGTVVPGGNLPTQTWTEAGSPYLVQGDVTIPAGAVLTLQWGTIVQFADSDAMAAGDDVDRVEVIVDGSLVVAGTQSQSVTMQPATGAAAGTWHGVIVSATASSASIQFLQQIGAQDGIRSRAPGSTLAVSDSTFTSNANAGIFLEAGRPSIIDVEIADSGGSGLVTAPSSSAAPTLNRVTVAGSEVDGLRLAATSGTTTVTNSTVGGNGRYGILKNGSGASLSVTSSTFYENRVRALVRSDSSSVTLRDSILANSGGGEDPDCSGGLSSAGNNLIENASLCGALDGTDLTEQDALLMGLADNGGSTRTQAPTSGSPAIDAGSGSCPAFDQRGVSRPADGDGDGTAACDIGAYELLTGIDGFNSARTLVTRPIEIVGHGFSEAWEVSFRGGSTTSFTQIGDRSIEAIVPIGALTGYVRVELPDRTLVSPTRLKILPWPRTVEPFSAARGSTITIGGYAFTGARHVTVGGVEAEFVVESYRKITAIVPATARTGFTKLKVTTAGGTYPSPRFRVTN
jgi:hypothetical protein